MLDVLTDTYTIWLREMARYRRNIRYLIFQFVFPFILIVLLGFGFGSMINMPGMSYLDFIGSGFLVFMIANGALGGGFNLIEERNNGFLREVIVAPVHRSSIILGKIAARVTLNTLQVLFLVIILSFMANLSLSEFHITFLALVLMTAMFVCVGVIMAAILKEAEVYRSVQGMVIFPLMFISGIFFPIDKLPLWLRWIAYANPVTYAVDLFRWSVLGKNIIPLWLDAVLLAVLSTGTFFFSVWLFDKKFRE
jgi:ABC-2 type transport system permease protein